MKYFYKTISIKIDVIQRKIATVFNIKPVKLIPVLVLLRLANESGKPIDGSATGKNKKTNPMAIFSNPKKYSPETNKQTNIKSVHTL